MPLKIDARPDGCEFSVKVVPGSRQAPIVGLLGDRLKIKVAEPPEEGRANAAVLRLLAATLGIPDGNLRILSGHAQPQKRLFVAGIRADTLTARLLG